MAAAVSQPPTNTNTSRASSVANGSASADFINGHTGLPSSPAANMSHASGPAAPAARKTKGKKPIDPNETGKLLAAKINQLEIDAAGEKDQELEIGRSHFIQQGGRCSNIVNILDAA